MGNESALSARRVVVTRALRQSKELVRRLEDHGAQVVQLPCIEIVPAAGSDDRLRETLTGKQPDWVFFTSANSARQFRASLQRIGVKNSVSGRYAAIGGKTADAAREAGFEVAFEATPCTADAFVAQFFSAGNLPRHVLYPTSSAADHLLESRLRERGVCVTRLDIYQTISAVDELQLHRLFSPVPDALVFYSPSAVHYFFDALSDQLRAHLSKTICAAIGTTTANALRERGIPVPLVAARPETDELIHSLLRYYEQEHTN